MTNQLNKEWIKKIEQARIKEDIIKRWLNGEKLSELKKCAEIHLSRVQWWILKKKYEKEGFEGLLDKRTGGKPKLTPEIRDWVVGTRKFDEDVSCEEITELLKNKFGVTVVPRTISGILKQTGSNRRCGRPQKEQLYDRQKGVPVDCAGSWFLKGADSDMEGIQTIAGIISDSRTEYNKEKNKPELRILKSSLDTINKKNETLLYLPVYGMERPYHLDKYHKRGLGLLTGSGKSYSYNTMDSYLGNLDKLEISEEMGKRLARCYLEALCIEIELKDGSYFYIDGHSKHVWSSKNIPKVFFTTLKRAERGLQQYFLNSSKGHPLILLTCPGDSHLTHEMFNLIESFENAVGKEIVKVSIFDREGLSLAVFEEFARRKKYFISLLRSNQYKGVEDFKIEKDFKPLKILKKRNGEKEVVEWVADASFQLKDTVTKKKLSVRVALVKKPVKGREKLIAIITNLTAKEEPDIARIARRYFSRWPNQENIFKDMKNAIKSDSNHGYKKKKVENRVLQRKKKELETNLRGINRKIPPATKEAKRIKKELESMKKVYESQKKILLDDRRELHRKIKFESSRKREELLEKLKKTEDKLLKLSEGYPKYINDAETKLKNKERHLKSLMSQRDNKEKEIKALNLHEALFDIKTEKDHIMSNFKILLTNLSRYAQEQYFPSEKEYQNATLETMLKTFYRQDGYVKISKTKVEVTLHSYDKPELQKAAEYACMKFNNSDLYTSGGQRILLGVES